MPFRGDPREPPALLPPPLRRRWIAGSAAISRTLRRSRTARRIDPGRRWKLPFVPFVATTDDGVRLACWYVEPPAEGRIAGGLVAVLHHHYGGQRATLLPWIDLFFRLGIPTVSFDARGHAASDASPLGRGSFPKRAADVRAAVRAARGFGAERILGFGQSQGAAVMAMGLAGERGVAGLIFDCGPAPDMMSAAWGLAGNLLEDGGADAATRALLAIRILPGTEPPAYAARLWTALFRLRDTPLLSLHGSEDAVIPERWSDLWFRTIRKANGPWSRVIIPDADHVRTLALAPDRVESAVRTFVDGLRG